ncbi:MAG: 50S ribosomal protein L18 [Oligoflexia bacterium]|nr:50S ribosomal protein L18 [Oligoflexia bacterium]
MPENIRKRLKRKKRGSFQVKGTEERPRLAVFRSNKGFYAQVINDDKGQTILAISSLDKDSKGSMKNTVEGVKSLGEKLAKKALSKSIDKVVYDRSGYLYHGKIKAFAEGARAGGLKF